MNYTNFIELLEEYINNIKNEAQILYEKDEEKIKYIVNILDQKLNHTKRVTDIVTNLAKKIDMHINYEKIVMASGIFHDIGRFKQGLLYGTYNDSLVFSGDKNHGDYGYELITSSPKEINIFDEVVEEKSRPAVATTVRFHQKGILPERFNKHIDNDLRISNPEEILTGSYNFNELEQKIVSALLHMVRDADRIDILWQRASGEIKPLNDNVYLKNTKDVDEMAKRWGVSKKIIVNNNDDNRLANNSHIIIPRKDIPIEKLFVNKNLLERMKRFEHIDLKSLQKENDYTFITALWWSVYTFLKDMNFVGNLKQVKEKEILDQIYMNYPKEYQPLLDEVFTFAKDILIDEQINNSKNNLYVKHL